MAEQVLTEHDKQVLAVRQEHKANYEATKDVPAEERTASHETLEGKLPSDYAALKYRLPSGKAHGGLTAAEAALLKERVDQGADEEEAFNDILAGRVVFHQHYVKLPAGSSHPNAPDPDTAPLSTVPYLSREDADPVAPDHDEPSSAYVTTPDGERVKDEDAAKARADAAQLAQDVAAHPERYEQKTEGDSAEAPEPESPESPENPEQESGVALTDEERARNAEEAQ